MQQAPWELRGVQHDTEQCAGTQEATERCFEKQGGTKRRVGLPRGSAGHRKVWQATERCDGKIGAAVHRETQLITNMKGGETPSGVVQHQMGQQDTEGHAVDYQVGSGDQREAAGQRAKQQNSERRGGTNTGTTWDKRGGGTKRGVAEQRQREGRRTKRGAAGQREGQRWDKERDNSESPDRERQ